MRKVHKRRRRGRPLGPLFLTSSSADEEATSEAAEAQARDRAEMGEADRGPSPVAEPDKENARGEPPRAEKSRRRERARRAKRSSARSAQPPAGHVRAPAGAGDPEIERRLTSRLEEIAAKQAQRLGQEVEAVRVASEQRLGAELEERLMDRVKELMEAARSEAAAELARHGERIALVEASAAETAAKVGAIAEQLLSDGDGRGDGRSINVNTATIDELRTVMSHTQAKRLVDYRDQVGEFGSLDALDLVPGFPRRLRLALKQRLQL